VKRFYKSLLFQTTLSLLLMTSFGLKAQVTVMTEGFEHGSNMPTGWTQEYVYDTLNWVFSSGGNNGHPATAHGGSYNALLYYGGIYRMTKLVSASMNLSAYSNLQLKFWHTQEEYSGDQDQLKVYYKTSASGSWVLLSSYTTNVSSWTQRTVNLPNPSSDYFIAFEGNARYGYGVCVDDIQITGTVTNGLDISCEGISSPQIWSAGNNTLKINYKNKRSDTIFNADFGYILDNNAAVIDTNKSTNTMLADQVKEYTFGSPISITKGNHYIKIWANKPNRTNPDDVPANDTFTLNFGTGIKDTFFIDASGNGDYLTFAAAVADLNNGVTGPVWFFVKPGTYNEKVIIGDIPGASSTNTIIFDGYYPDSTILTYAGTSTSDRATLALKGADYVTFKNMTIKNTAYSYAVAVLLRNESNFNTFYNCHLELRTTATNSYAQVVLSSNAESERYGQGSNCSNLTIDNCLIKGGYVGVNLYGLNTASPDTNNTIKNSVFDQVYYRGVYAYYQLSLNVESNSIIGFRHNNAYGIQSYYSAGSLFNANLIKPGIYGIYMYRENYYKQTETSYITNNIIVDFANGVNQRGIALYYYCYNVKVYHNSIYVDGTSTSPYYAAVYVYYYANNSEIKNNILASNGTTYLLSLTYANNLSVDYNDYYYGTSGSTKFYINYNYTTFSTFKSMSTYINYPHDLNSYDNIDPGFVSTTDLHLDTLNSVSLMAPSIGILKDIDGESRSTTLGVNIGADEIPHPNRDLDIVSIDSPYVLKIGNNTVAVTLQNMGMDSLLAQTIYLQYNVNGGSWVQDSLLLTSKLPPFGVVSHSFSTPFFVSGNGSQYICVRINPGIINDPDSIDELCVSKCLGIRDTFYIGKTGNVDYTSFSAAVSAMQSCGVSGSVTFIVKAGTYIERVIIPEIIGASSTNTITFVGEDKNNVVLIHAGSSTNRATILLNGADHIIFKNLTISNNGNTYATGVHFMQQADSNVIQNCILTINSGTNSYMNPIVASSSEQSYYSYGNSANANIIADNTITGGYMGVVMNGTDKSNLCEGNRILRNTFNGQYYYGIRYVYQKGIEVKGNLITNMSLSYAMGIYSYYSTSSNIQSNNIHPGRYGIYLYRENDVFPTNESYVINNMISDFSDGAYQTGIYAYYNVNHLNILHNSINLDGTTSSASYGCIRLYNSCDSAIIMNNILSTTGNNYLLSLTSSTGIFIDFNNYYYPNATGNVFYNNAYYASLTAFKNSSSYIVHPHDVNSFDNINPGFKSSSDLHIDSTTAGLGGDTLGIMFDIDGDQRCMAYPTIGADEKGPIADFVVNAANQCMSQNNFVFSNISDGGSASLNYFWTFGDGDTSSSKNPTHSYLTPGTYTVTLIVYPSIGCNDTFSMQVSVNPSPQIGFTINDSMQCQYGNYFAFTNTTSVSSGTISYNWNFGDGYSAGLTSPVHAFSYADTFDVQLIASTNLGCADTLIKKAYVFPMPDADFSFNSGTQCQASNNFVFINATSISSGSVNYFWDFDDGNTSVLENPSHTYATIGSYDVKLRATSALNCSDSVTKTTSVVPTPTASFTVNDTDQCLNLNSFSFTNTSYISSGGLNYQWTFGDGGSSTLKDPVYQYLTAGTYEVKLVVSSASGCSDSVSQKVIIHPSLIADFTINNDEQCYHGNSFTFTNTTTISTGSTSYSWDFGDGTTSVATSPSHSYSTFGALDVRLIALSTNSCSDTISKQVMVYNMPLDVNDEVLDSRLKDSLLAYYPFTANANDISGMSNNGTIYGASLTADRCSHADSAYYFDGNDYIRVPHAILLTPQSSCAFSAWIYPTQSGGTQYLLYKYQSNLYKGYRVALVNNKIAADFGGSFSMVYSSQNVNLNQWNHVVVSYDGWNYELYLNNELVGSGIAANNYLSITPLYIGSAGTSSYFKGNMDEVRIYNKSLDRVEINALYHEIPQVQLLDSFVCAGNTTSVLVHNSEAGVAYQLKEYPGGTNVGSVVYGNGCSISLPVGNISGLKQYQIHAGDTGTSCQLLLDTILTINVAPMPNMAFSVSPTSSCLRSNSFSLSNSSTISSGSLSYLWDFGDLTTSSQTHPNHQYTYADSFDVKLMAITNYGCVDSLIKSVLVFPQPSADFIIADSSQCLDDNAFGFVNTSSISSGNMSYLWSFGDGHSSAQTSPIHSYAYADTFLVKLVVTSDKGCVDSIVRTTYLQVNPNPNAAFSINDSTQCLNINAISLSNASTISSGSMNYYWRFGDGNASTQTNPSFQYVTYDTFDITLLAISDKGCKDSIIHQAYIYPNPVSRFTISDSIQCLTGNLYVFSNLTTLPYGSATSVWTFGDGNSSSSSDPTHSYVAAGNYRVNLLSTSNLGCIDSFDAHVVVEPSPIANYSINDNTQCLDGNSFSFTDMSTGGSGSLTYDWDFGDGTSASSQNPSHTYSVAGTYQVKLLISYGAYCKDSLTKQVEVYHMPSASFNVNDSTQCLDGNQLNFSNTSAISSGSLNYEWSFGDGQTSTLTSPQHSYTASGQYNIKLLVVSSNACRDSAQKSIDIWPMPTASFSVNSTNQCLDANSFTFNNSSSISAGSMTYLWTFGDGNTSTSASPTHMYLNSGTYSVKLVVSSDHSCQDSMTQSITVNPMPVASFTLNEDSLCYRGNLFSFSNTSNILSGSLNYVWDFGDNATSSQTSPDHAYQSAGNYLVKLLVVSDQNCRDSAFENTFVLPSPKAGFTINDSDQCLNTNNFVFANATTISSGTFNSFWTFGDAGSSSLTNPVKQYASANTYTTKLVVESSLGCKDSIEKQLIVYPVPLSDFNVNMDSQCFANNQFVFTNTSTLSGGSMNYLWSFGDAATSSAQHSVHTYATAGSFNVQLISTSDKLCSDTTSQRMEVLPSPLAGFTVNDTSQCFNLNSFSFTNTSSITSGNMHYIWYFGDGDTASATNPVHNYLQAGTYDVKLKVFSDYSCIDSAMHRIYVYPNPVASYTVSDTDQCLYSNSFVFTNTSSLSSGSMIHAWTFGDGGTAATTNATHSYLTDSSYQTQLIVLSDQNCSDTSRQMVYVYPMPNVDFSVNDTDQCENGNNFILTNNSTISSGSLSYAWDFGDNYFSSVTDTNYTYALAATYALKLVATSSHNCLDSAEQSLYVYPNPVIDFSVNDSMQCFNGHQFMVYDSSTIASGNINYLWSFGDGNSSTQQNPQFAYSTPDTFELKLRLQSDKACMDSSIQKLYVHASPNADFTINDSSQCQATNNFVFTDQSQLSSGSLTYLWHFGDGDTSTTTSPVHSYTNAGAYSVKLLLQSQMNCYDSVTKALSVHSSPIADFSLNDSMQCQSGNQFVLTNLSSISNGNLSYHWDFGDADTSGLQHASHSYLQADTFNIQLLVHSDDACMDSVSQTVYVFASPQASFTVNDSVQCSHSNQFIFSNQSVISSGSMTYLWLFGDGDSSRAIADTHSYQAATYYPVELIATSDLSCTDTFFSYVHIHESPTALISVNDSDQCFHNNQFVFTNNSTIANDSLTYTWTFGDGQTSSQKEPLHAYAVADSYIVKLVANSMNACQDSMQIRVYVYPTPLVDFAINKSSQCYGSNLFLFNNLTPLVDSLNWLWSFGDGQSDTMKDAAHIYNAVDTFDVKLLASSIHHCADSISKQVITLAGPRAQFTVNDEVQCLATNHFILSNISQNNGFVPKYYWYFGDGDTASASNTTHSYQDTGLYSIKLVVAPDSGCTDTASMLVHVQPMPIADFSINDADQCHSLNQFVFTNLSTGYGYPNSVKWYFGDGTSDTSFSTSHSYALSGNYSVSLVIQTDEGCLDSIVKTVQVFSDPVAEFSLVDTAQCFFANVFTLTDHSSGTGSLSYHWDFGDGNASTKAGNESHSYTQDGVYPILLVVETANACKDSFSRSAYVYPEPSADFMINDSDQCQKYNLFELTNMSSIANASLDYHWSFGDGKTSVLENPDHHYASAQNYTIKLVATSDKMCSDSVSKNIQVFENPVADYNINENNQCLLNNHFVYLNNSSLSSGTLSYLWDFGGGDTSGYTNTSHIFLTSGTFDVILIATSDQGCVDSFTKQSIVHPMPDADFSVNENPQCFVGNLFEFSNTSSIANGSMSYIWYYGDGDSSLLSGPVSHSYDTLGTYDVRLIATSDRQCVDTIQMQVSLKPSPEINLGKDIFTTPNVIFDIDAGGGYASYTWHDGTHGRYYSVNTNALGIGDHLIHVTITDAFGCENSDSIWVFVWPVSIDEHSNRIAYRLYPNPARNYFNIEFEGLYDTEINIVVEDVRGREVYHRQYNPFSDNSVLRVDLQEAKGIYFVKMQLGNRMEVHKVLMY
jgi:PKD repeat protein